MSCAFEKKKGEELTKGGTGPSSSEPLSLTATRHPLPFDGNATGWPTGLGPPLPPVGLLPPARLLQGGPTGLLPLAGPLHGGLTGLLSPVGP
jgi:hypothetical protein